MKNLMTSVKRRQLKWYGHVARSSGLAKTRNSSRKEGDEEADRGNGGKTSKSGLALNETYYGKLRTARSGGNWL